MSTIVDSRLRGTYTSATCPQCSATIEYQVPPTFIGGLRVRCVSCKTLLSHPIAQSSGNAGAGTGAASRSRAGGRSIGSDERPLDMAYYDVLGVDSQCSLSDIKKAYRRMAIKLHPDKNRDDPDAEEKFKQIAIAYQVLSDPDLRHKYNEFGQKNGGGSAEPAGGFQDPEEVFGSLFGGERFHDFIGVISIGRDMKDALQGQHEEEDFQAESGQPIMVGPNGKPILTPEQLARKAAREKKISEEKAKARKERVDKLVANLVNKISIFTESAQGVDDRIVGKAFKDKCRLEAEELREESYGVELLHAIGKTYQAKAEHYKASSSFAPLGWFHGAKASYNLVTETVSTLRAALELKAVFERLQAAEQSGMSPEALKKLEEQAAEQGMRTMWKGAKLEVESVIRETCDRILADPTVPKGKLELRAVALGLMGDAFASIRKEGEEPAPSAAEEFVKIDTPTSKAREGAQASATTSKAPPPIPNKSRPAEPTATASAPNETLDAAYAAYQSKRSSQSGPPPVPPRQ